jgi:hypothetical protein
MDITQEYVLYGAADLGNPNPNSYSIAGSEIKASPIIEDISLYDNFTNIAKGEGIFTGNIGMGTTILGYAKSNAGSELNGVLEFLDTSFAYSVTASEGEFKGDADVDGVILAAANSKGQGITQERSAILPNVISKSVSNSVGLIFANPFKTSLNSISGHSISAAQGLFSQVTIVGDSHAGNVKSIAQAILLAYPEKVSNIPYESFISGEGILTSNPVISYTEGSSKRYFLVEKRTLFGPDSLDHVKDADELY